MATRRNLSASCAPVGKTLVVCLLAAALVGCPDEDGPPGDTPDTGGGSSDVLDDLGSVPDTAFNDTTDVDDTSSLPETSVDAGPSTPDQSDCAADPGAPFCVCVDDSDCATGHCIVTAQGNQCAPPCDGGCLPGWSCQNLAPPGPGAESSLVCTDRTRLLCTPCSNDAECAVPGFEGDVCRNFGAPGSFCVSPCTGDGHCKTGYSCTEGLCLPGGGECECSPLAISLNAKTSCLGANEIGSCNGQRECGPNGLTACDAPVPTEEACDGADNDCDGATDENLADQACDVTNAFGTCTGTETCADGGWQCDAATPEAEACDGLDNDCDGETDEGYPDFDDDGIADCVEEDTDGDTIPDITDNCVFAHNTDQLNSDGDALGDACDPDDDNDNTLDDDDCEPLDAAVYPGADEVCDGLDNDCDTVIDEKACDDGNPCTDDLCDPAAGCSNPANTAPCTDGDQCTEADTCDGGSCVGTFVDCNDGNPCTDDSCDSTGGCVQVNNTAPCDDGNLCTTNEQCQSGVCLPGGFTACEDGGPCVLTTCDPASGCQPTPVANPCNDDDPCTVSDTCSNGSCVGTGKICDDGDPCTIDSCDSGVAGGCVFAPTSGADCDDGLECTTDDVCTDGTCAGTDVGGCDCESDLDCVDDGDLCNGTLYCDKSEAIAKCRVKADTVVTCTVPDGLDPSCVSLSCDPLTGGCTATPADNGTSCDDGSLCTVDDQCQAGVCQGSAKDCDDGNPCTVGTCDEVQSCVQIPADGFVECDDANACTTNDACTGGFCAGATPVTCDDGNPCTTDVCVPGSGCSFEPNANPCDDGDACTLADTCQDGSCGGDPRPCDDGDACNGAESCDANQGCLPGLPLVCDDAIACTQDQCQPASGCLNTPMDAACDDGEPCTGEETCDSALGCVGTPLDEGAACDDGDECTTLDACQNETCTGIEVTCDDNNVCTSDVCDPASGCVFTAVVGFKLCDDGDACTDQDQCTGGFCVGELAVVCDDDNPCTDDGCDADGGCVFTNNSLPCSDGDACTFDDTCAAGGCIGQDLPCDDGNACNGQELCDSVDGCLAGIAPVCDDGVPCTDDSCQPASGCVNTPNHASCNDGEFCTGLEQCDPDNGCVATAPDAGTPCNDGNPCTQNDACQSGLCVGTETHCDDFNECTVDSCDPEQGCVSEAVLGFKVCDDGNECTTQDACSGGFCVGGAPPVCNDGNPCTDDGCDTNTGCIFGFNTEPCDDGKACTTADTCTEGNCVGSSAQCDDGNVCNGAESCDQSSGCLPGIPLTCDDGIPCTQDTCSSTDGCKHLPNHPACDDGQVCTGLEQCDPELGCLSPLAPAGTPCDDGNDCTTDDECGLGLCFGTPKECNDLNPCTVDACEPEIGCVSTPVAGFLTCDDGDACTAEDQCVAGFCQGSTAVLCNDDNPCTDDTCDAELGCQNTPNDLPCDDGNACTSDDVCDGGTCAGVGVDCAIVGLRISTPSVSLKTGPVSPPAVTTSGSAGQASPVGPTGGSGVTIRWGFHAR